MLIVIYLLYVKLSETIHINRLLGGRHLFLLNKAEKSQTYCLSRYQLPIINGLYSLFRLDVIMSCNLSTYYGLNATSGRRSKCYETSKSL
ncbi:hypothetical protein [Kiloniella sp.]|uniref:hypothetical protein n=1 Tax=Kiloniella sp. TaxID=1938587 RepID=UPI003B011270